MTDRQEENLSLVLRGARVVTPTRVLERADVHVERGRITRVSDAETNVSNEDADARGARSLDLEGLTLYPGFVDVHIHGSVGVDLMEADPEDLRRVARFLAASGVTTWVPTLVPGPVEEYRRAIGSVEELMRTQDSQPSAARAAGIHYEGPFVNERQCGALRTEFFRAFDSASKLDELPTLSVEGAAHLMTLAPEVEGGVPLIKELVARGWVASVGHTRAGLDTLNAARGAGARHMTHFLNAMSPLHHREPGPIGWGLLQDDVTVDLIADGVHSVPLMLRVVLRCKGAERVSLISDAVAPAGLGDGDYRLWGETIRVREGRTSNERGSIAGSVITMLDAARMIRTLGLAERDVARTASLNPSRLLGLQDRGSIEEGKRADLTALDDSFNVRLTIVGGRVAHQTEQNRER
jgi:N-acetylglucosamine-6-phosphate deacetylase